MPTFFQDGAVLDHTPGANVAAGTPVDLGSGLIGIPDNDLTANVKGAVTTAGVYAVPNPDGTAFNRNVAVGWDATNNKAVLTGTGDFDLGNSAYAAGAGDTVVYVLLNNRNL